MHCPGSNTLLKPSYPAPQTHGACHLPWLGVMSKLSVGVPQRRLDFTRQTRICEVARWRTEMVY